MSLIKYTSLKRWFFSFLCLILLLNGLVLGVTFLSFSAQMSGWQLTGLLGAPIIGLMLCLGGAYHFSRQIVAPLKEINAWFTGEGQSNPQIEGLSAYEEIRQLAAHTRSLLHKVQRTTVFMEEVGKGNLQVELGEFSANEKDTLTQALLSTRNRLLENQEASRQRSWSAEGITQLEELLRKHNSRLDLLAENVIQFLVKYLKANQAALFLVQEDENKVCLDMASCYAYARKKFMEKRIQPGEGLVGQVFLEKAPFYLTDLPQGYTSITSGLGEATPTALILVPLQVEEKVIGVVELASFSTFEEHQRHFLNKAAQSIASSIMNVQVNMQTSRLLEQSQQQTEELRAQEEEMRQNMEELEATQEEMQRVTAEMQGQLSAINHTMATISFSPDGYILEANENFLKLMGYREDEIKGRHHRMFVEAGEAEGIAYTRFWEALAKGENKTGDFSRINKAGQEVRIRGIYNPIKDKAGKVQKVLKLAYALESVQA